MVSINLIQHKKSKKMKNNILKVIALLGGLGIMSSCAKEDLGEVTMNSYEQQEFSQVEIDTEGEIVLYESTAYKVEIETNMGLMNNFKINVSNGKLFISSQFNQREERANKTIRINIYAPTFTSIEMDGVGNLQAYDGITTDELYVELDGVGNIDITNIEVTALYVKQDGVGNMRISGATETADYMMDSPGNIYAFLMIAQRVTAEIDGVGDIELFANESLSAKIDGVGDIFYKGNPTISKAISGVGQLIDAN